MDYRKLYNEAIDKYKVQEFPEGVYTEVHHIIPRHMGGDDSHGNLVKVTYRQHILLHLLLWKGMDSIKDRAAYLLMSGQKSSVEMRRELQRLSKLGVKWTEDLRKVILEGRKEWMNSPEYLEHQRKNLEAARVKKIAKSKARSDKIVRNAERNLEFLAKKSVRSKYKFVSPEGLIFDSPIFAAKYYGTDVNPVDIENWCKRKKYGWNTIPELAKA